MKRSFLRVALAAGVVGVASVPLSHAQDRAGAGWAPQAVEQNLRQYYPDARYTIRDSRSVNGVTVYDVDIDTPQGITTARLNDRGEFLVSGRPARLEEAPPAVRDALAIFRAPEHFDELVATYYYVQVAPAGREPYELKLDGAGRVIDIRSQRQLRQSVGDAPPSGPPISDAERRRIDELATKEFQGGRVTDMRRWNEAEGFTIAAVEANGRRGSVLFDQQGQIVSNRIEVDRAELPEPVRRSIAETFNTDIRQAHRSRQKHYHLRQRIGDETLSMRVHFNGDVMEVRSERAGGDSAITAGRREDRDRERDRERDRFRERDERDRARERDRLRQ